MIIDEALLGSISAEKLVLRIYEDSPAERTKTHPDVHRIFFLVRNPDPATYAVPGAAYIQSLVDGRYVFYELDQVNGNGPGAYTQKVLEFVSDTDATQFENALLAEIQKQNR